jgi:hypothetical protein
MCGLYIQLRNNEVGESKMSKVVFMDLPADAPELFTRALDRFNEIQEQKGAELAAKVHKILSVAKATGDNKEIEKATAKVARLLLKFQG